MMNLMGRTGAPTAPVVPEMKPPSAGGASGIHSGAISSYLGALPRMHKGGKVKGKPNEDVPVVLKAGETVRTPEQEKKMEEKMKKKEPPKKAAEMLGGEKPEKKAEKKEPEKKDGKSKGKIKHKHTHIEHHDDGSHTVRHTPVGGGEEVSYSKPDLEGVKQGLDANIGAAPAAGAGGEEADAGAAMPPAAGGGAPPPAAAMPVKV